MRQHHARLLQEMKESVFTLVSPFMSDDEDCVWTLLEELRDDRNQCGGCIHIVHAIGDDYSIKILRCYIHRYVFVPIQFPERDLRVSVDIFVANISGQWQVAQRDPTSPVQLSQCQPDDSAANGRTNCEFQLTKKTMGLYRSLPTAQLQNIQTPVAL
jgi:hypothetical protein